MPKISLLRILMFLGGASVLTLAAWWIYEPAELYVPKPAAPYVLSAQFVGNGCSVNVYFTDNSTNEDGFRVKRRNHPFVEPWKEIALLGPHAGSSATYTESNLPNGMYAWQVCAFNESGESCSNNDSGVIEINDLDCLPVNETPFSLIITDIAVEGSCKARFWYTDKIDTEIGMHVYRRIVGQPAFVQIDELGPHVGEPGSYDDPNLEVGTYEYQIGAFDASTEYLSNVSDPVEISGANCQTFEADSSLAPDALLPTSTAQACTWRAATNIFVRKGPGASIYPELTAVEQLTELPAVGQSENGEFWAVEVAPGLAGYVPKAEKFGSVKGTCESVPTLQDPLPPPTQIPTRQPAVSVPQCSDGLDNDGDRLIDMSDRECDSPNDNSE